ncbi:hypothetical protein [Nocardioides panaciterrulae]|uniref:Uncharacterized protein n=1 Tax=Nocardioides panaciterrulae TaxID=661492 RepID=A0A7Y9J9D2_9ACTN|nr:hypothetical protein [Nocardioides panaciterrulae]NYD40041.1 hypothetical protein [Nocardioides panaciterrulae]
MDAGQTILLEGLLRAQDRDNEVVGYAQIQRHAEHVIDWASRLTNPVLMPVGDAAQRLLGAVSLMAQGSIDIPVWTDRLDGRDVLLVGTVVASLIEFEAAAINARRRGATHIHGCAIEVAGHTSSSMLDSFTLLGQSSLRARRSA